MQLVAAMENGVLIETDDGLVECESNQSNHKKRRSLAWDHFERLPCDNKNEGKAKCIHCNMLLTAAPRSGTSHLKRHVERCPKRVALDITPIAMRTCELNGSGQENHINSSIQRRKFSKVWEEFDRINTEGTNETKAKCRHCNAFFSASAKNGTSHLKRHLDKCPKRIVMDVGGDIRPYLVPSVNDKFFDEGANFTESSQIDPDELRKYIALCIIEGGHSLSFVEERGFRRMMSRACPRFKPFSRSVVRKELFSMYVKERENVKELIANAPGKICIAADKWKARDSVDEYICVTAYFVDCQWKLQRRILCFRVLAPPYEGASIANEVAYSLAQWNVEHKILSVTTDDVSYNGSMVSAFKRSLLGMKILHHSGSVSQVSCYENMLNHVAQSTLKTIDNVLEKIRDLVKYVNKSPLQRKKIYNLAETKFQLSAKKGLKLDTPLRWNSTYKLIGHVLYYKSVFMDVVDWDESLKITALSEEEWRNLSVAHKFLKVIYDVTFMILGTKCPAASLYLKGILMVHCRMVEMARGQHTFFTDMVKQLQVEFDDYWSKNNLILSCAAILDPRYKVKFVEYCYMKLYGGSNVAEHVSRVVSSLYCYFGDYKQRSAAFPSQCVGSSSASTNFASASDEGDVFGDYNQFLSMTSRSQGSKSELDLYLEEPSYDLNCDLDVLEFWNKSSMRYPELSVMARDILSVPVSTVPLKSAFYTGSKTLSSNLSWVMPETAQALNCLQDWLFARNDSDDCTIQAEGSSDDAGYDDDDDDSVLTDCF